MLTYRTFRNTDPPVITALWRSRAGQRGLMHPVSPDLFEQLVFAKLYFDYRGLVLAWDDGQAVGFAHAGFGPNEAGDDVSFDWGVTCLVLVRPDYPAAEEVAAGLLERCEQYLRQRGAKVLYGGGIQPLNPFYLGLYGGSELPGILDSDAAAQEVLRAHQYQEIDQTHIFQCDLSGFQTPIDRRQMQIRRQMVVEVTVDAPMRSWWEACTLCEFDLTRFDLIPRGGSGSVATAVFRSMEPTGATMLGRTMGLIELKVDETQRRHGLASFVLSEAFRQFLRQGIATVEVQAMEHNPSALSFYRKLGFQEVGKGSVFRKEGGVRGEG